MQSQSSSLGAIANALLSVGSMVAGCLTKGLAQERDVLQAGLIAVSYIKEAVEIFDNQPRPWALVEKGVAGGRTLPHPVAHYKDLFSRGSGSLDQRLLKDTRNFKGFHIDAHAFEKWIQTTQEPEITLGNSKAHSILTGSLWPPLKSWHLRHQNSMPALSVK